MNKIIEGFEKRHKKNRQEAYDAVFASLGNYFWGDGGDACPGISFWLDKRGESMRTFESGATRDDDETKSDYEGYLSPLAIRRYGEYMSSHRTQADGKMRASDNWQKGMPLFAYMKSMWRHVMDLWTLHRGHEVNDKKDSHPVSEQEALCGVIFNAMGYLHVLETEKREGPAPSFIEDSPATGSQSENLFPIHHKEGGFPLHRNAQGRYSGAPEKKTDDNLDAYGKRTGPYDTSVRGLGFRDRSRGGK